MPVNYAKSYVDRACESRDVFTLYEIVHTLGAERGLSEPLKLFMRMWEWSCSTRSGVWQYYENISPTEFHNTAAMMDRYNLAEIAERYRSGLESWQSPDCCRDLDTWIDAHWSQIETAALELIDRDRKFLYPIPK